MVYAQRTSVPREATWRLELSHGRLDLPHQPFKQSHPCCSTASLGPSSCCIMIGMLQTLPLPHPESSCQGAPCLLSAVDQLMVECRNLLWRAHSRRWFLVPMRALFLPLSGCQKLLMQTEQCLVGHPAEKNLLAEFNFLKGPCHRTHMANTLRPESRQSLSHMALPSTWSRAWLSGLESWLCPFQL